MEIGKQIIQIFEFIRDIGNDINIKIEENPLKEYYAIHFKVEKGCETFTTYTVIYYSATISEMQSILEDLQGCKDKINKFLAL